MPTTYDHEDRPEIGLGGSRPEKDQAKGLYFDPPLYMPSSGVVFTYVDVIDKAELEAGPNWDANLMPWATRHTKGLEIRTSGYTGTVSGTGVVFEIYNGLIVDVS